MKHPHRTIFRVVGGHSTSGVFNEYAIIPYLVIQENPTFWRLERNGKIGVHVKRETRNSKFVNDIDEAGAEIRHKLQTAIESVSSTISSCRASEFVGLPYRAKFFIGKFETETFTLACYRVIDTTKSGTRIDTEQTRIQTRRHKYSNERYNVEVSKGRSYIYNHTPKPHDPTHPTEKWVGRKLDEIKSDMQEYADDRLIYLRRCIQKNDDFIRLWNREHKEDL